MLVLLLMISITVMAVSYVAYQETRKPVVPIENPMDNRLAYDGFKTFVDKYSRMSAKEIYYDDIHRPLEDYFETQDAYRNFYSQPKHSREEYQEFLYGSTVPSCKDRQEDCFPNYRTANV